MSQVSHVRSFVRSLTFISYSISSLMLAIIGYVNSLVWFVLLLDLTLIELVLFKNGVLGWI